jgi:hypothetical protein
VLSVTAAAGEVKRAADETDDTDCDERADDLNEAVDAPASPASVPEARETAALLLLPPVPVLALAVADKGSLDADVAGRGIRML